MTDIRFAACLPFILKEEGSDDDDPHDPGGRTSRGIIQREYDAWRRTHGEPVRDVWTATDEEVAAIYDAQYWQPWCAKMPAGVDLVFFDMSVLQGPHEATILLQRALGVRADGHIGLVTLAAGNVASSVRLIADVSDRRRAFFRGLHTFKYFGRGWLARVQRIETAALHMAAVDAAYVGTIAQEVTP